MGGGHRTPSPHEKRFITRRKIRGDLCRLEDAMTIDHERALAVLRERVWDRLLEWAAVHEAECPDDEEEWVEDSPIHDEAIHQSALNTAVEQSNAALDSLLTLNAAVARADFYDVCNLSGLLDAEPEGVPYSVQFVAKAIDVHGEAWAEADRLAREALEEA